MYNLTANGYVFLYSQVLKAFDYFYPSKGQQQMYKLDISWPKIPEYFTGQTFCVAVDSLHGLVYVGQVSESTKFLFLIIQCICAFKMSAFSIFIFADTCNSICVCIYMFVCKL